MLLAFVIIFSAHQDHLLMWQREALISVHGVLLLLQLCAMVSFLKQRKLWPCFISVTIMPRDYLVIAALVEKKCDTLYVVLLSCLLLKFILIFCILFNLYAFTRKIICDGISAFSFKSNVVQYALKYFFAELYITVLAQYVDVICT